MHKPHDHTGLTELQSEERIELASTRGDPAPGADRELAADAALKAELAALRLPQIPGHIRQRVLASMRWRRRGPWLMAAAAVLAAALVSPRLFQPDSPPAANPAELGELQLAFDTISRTTRDALALAGSHLVRQMTPAQPGRDRLPGGIDPHTDDERSKSNENG